jgi:hypothetical protein
MGSTVQGHRLIAAEALGTTLARILGGEQPQGKGGEFEQHDATVIVIAVSFDDVGRPSVYFPCAAPLATDIAQAAAFCRAEPEFWLAQVLGQMAMRQMQAQADGQRILQRISNGRSLS